jgi:glycosyltransferase involved in cell wall biosynthesis
MSTQTHPYSASVPVVLRPRSTESTADIDAACSSDPPVVCHVTVAHRELKSRTFYMQLAPLAAMGTRVRYVSSVTQSPATPGVTFIPLRAAVGRTAQLWSTISLIGALLAQNANVYHFQDPELLLAAFLLKLAFGKRVVFDSYEDFASMALNSNRIPEFLKPLAEKSVLQLQKLAAQVFDAVITADPLTLRRFARSGRSRKLVFYNFPNLDLFPPPLDCSKPYDVVYRGGVSERAGTWTLLDALRLLKSRGRPVKALLIGYFDNFEAKAQLGRRIDALDLGANVVLEGRIEHSSMARALSQARIGVSPLLDIPKFQRNIPVKIFEYWACGLPAIASDLAPIRPFFRTANAGLLYRAGDVFALADSIENLLSQPGLAEQMGRRGRAAVESRLNNRSEVHKLHRLITEVAAGR